VLGGITGVGATAGFAFLSFFGFLASRPPLSLLPMPTPYAATRGMPKMFAAVVDRQRPSMTGVEQAMASSGRNIRGSRVGSGPLGESDRGHYEPSAEISYWCVARHRTVARFVASAEVPDEWTCAVCSRPAGRSPDSPPAPPPTGVFPKTPYEFLLMRRTLEDGEKLLDDALEQLRRRRGDTKG
jgi:hypothetical protein